MTARMLSWIKALKKASLSYPISAIRWAGRSSVRILNVVRRGVVCLPAYEVEGERDAVDIIWRFLRCQGISFEQLCLHLSGTTHRGEAGHQSTGRVHDLPQSSRSCFVRACRSPARLTPSMSPQHPLRTKCQKIHGLLLSSISLIPKRFPLSRPDIGAASRSSRLLTCRCFRDRSRAGNRKVGKQTESTLDGLLLCECLAQSRSAELGGYEKYGFVSAGYGRIYSNSPVMKSLIDQSVSGATMITSIAGLPSMFATMATARAASN